MSNLSNLTKAELIEIIEAQGVEQSPEQAFTRWVRQMIASSNGFLEQPEDHHPEASTADLERLAGMVPQALHFAASGAQRFIDTALDNIATLTGEDPFYKNARGEKVFPDPKKVDSLLAYQFQAIESNEQRRDWLKDAYTLHCDAYQEITGSVFRPYNRQETKSTEQTADKAAEFLKKYGRA